MDYFIPTFHLGLLNNSPLDTNIVLEPLLEIVLGDKGVKFCVFIDLFIAFLPARPTGAKEVFKSLLLKQ